MEDKNTSFLGRGWGFPPTFLKDSNSVVMSENETDIKQSLEILIGTALGERVMRPDYGSNMESYVFEPLDNTLKTLLESNIRDAILLHESRIVAEKITLDEDIPNGRIDITVEFFIPTVNTRTNFVYPFYIREATA